MGTPTETTLEPGRRLAHYEIRRPIGAGAMGTVYEAHDTALDRTVAIKVLNPQISGDPATVARFGREARAAARVNHENLTHIYFVDPDDQLWFAMEYVPGSTLDELIEKRGPLDPDEAIDILVQVAKGLAAAHGADVIHRDVKPSNLKVLPNGTVKLTDFGLSKRVTGETDQTGEGRIVGTPRYMSPEQCRGEKLDWRTDLYSLGLVGYHLLTAKHAFDADSIGKLLDEQMNKPLPPLRDRRPDISPGLARAIADFCEKDRERRPKSMEIAIRRLENARPRPIDPAPFAARASAFAIDMVIAFLFLLTCVGAITWAYGERDSATGPRFWIAGVAASAFIVFTQLGAEAWRGRSIGKAFFRLRVVRRDGSRARFSSLASRFAFRLPIAVVGFFPLLPQWAFGLAWIVQLSAAVAGVICFFVFRQQTLSDLATRTRVVYRGRPEPPEYDADE